MLPVFSPNAKVSANAEKACLFVTLGAMALLWWMIPSRVIPGPQEILGSFPRMWNAGLGVETWTSLMLNFQAVSIAAILSMAVAYGTVVPALRPAAEMVAAGRFNGFVGLPLLLTFMIGDQHWIKVTLLVISMAVFTVPSIVSVIEAIPREAYDHGRVLRMSEWRVVWEVVILGRMSDVLDILRTNMAIGWMMLPMVEGIFRSEGGIGVLIMTENKYFHLAEVYCITLFVAGLGWWQNLCMRGVKRLLCPYSFINMER